MNESVVDTTLYIPIIATQIKFRFHFLRISPISIVIITIFHSSLSLKFTSTMRLYLPRTTQLSIISRKFYSSIFIRSSRVSIRRLYNSSLRSRIISTMIP